MSYSDAFNTVILNITYFRQEGSAANAVPVVLLSSVAQLHNACAEMRYSRRSDLSYANLEGANLREAVPRPQADAHSRAYARFQVASTSSWYFSQ